MTERRVARRYYVSGMVQGVGYRYFVQRVAERLELTGYAKNLRDGRVEVYAIGKENDLGGLRAQLERGPESASVSGVSESDAPIEAKYGRSFSIEFDA
ncbi:MAG TPA: acylphosphatase [Candidatus Binatia bacterium]|nr:acylphosphatase [Candidatus Binatia bacterium]